MNTMTLKKTIAGATLAFVAMFGLVGSAKAQTLAELQALVASLMAQIEALQGGSTGSSCGTTYGYTATSTLRPGMSGAAVSALQTALNNYGGASLAVDGAYGPATSAAVRAFQASKGLGQDGIAGPMTQGALATASMMTGANCDNGNGNGNNGSNDYDLNGNVGSATYELVSQYAGEEVGEGDDDVVVAGLRIEAGNDSDIMITSIKLDFLQGTAADSTDLDDYASEISVWFKGEKVADIDADEFSEQSDDSWEATLPLDAGVVIEAEEEEDLLVAVSALSNLDSGDIDTDAWTVDFTTVRFVDGDGVVTSEDAGTNAVAFDFADFATASDIEMKVALHNSNMDARVVEVDDSSDTDGVELLKFTIEAEGSDITIEDLPVLLTVTGATDVDVVANTLHLQADGEEWSESITSSAASVTVTFDNIDFTIDEGDKVTFTVLADINDIDTGFDEGDTIKAELRSFEVDAIDAEDQVGENISDTDATGTALGDEVSFYETGIMVSFEDASVTNYVDDGADDDTGEFILQFRVEAFGGTVYVGDTANVTISSSIAESTLTSGNMLYVLEDSGTATADDQATDVDFTENDGADNSAAGNIELEDGESTVITLTITQTNDSIEDDGIYRAFLKAIMWNTTDATNLYNVYDFNLDDFKTGALSLN